MASEIVMVDSASHRYGIHIHTCVTDWRLLIVPHIAAKQVNNTKINKASIKFMMR